MSNLVVLFVHVMVTVARLLGPGGVRSVAAESVLVNQQLLILNRSRQRSPNLCFSDRLVVGLCALFIRPARLIRSAIVLKQSISDIASWLECTTELVVDGDARCREHRTASR